MARVGTQRHRKKNIYILCVVFVALSIQHEKRMGRIIAYCHLWTAWLYEIFPHYFIKGTIFAKTLLRHEKCVLNFSTIFV